MATDGIMLHGLREGAAVSLLSEISCTGVGATSSPVGSQSFFADASGGSAEDLSTLRGGGVNKPAASEWDALPNAAAKAAARTGAAASFGAGQPCATGGRSDGASVPAVLLAPLLGCRLPPTEAGPVFGGGLWGTAACRGAEAGGDA